MMKAKTMTAIFAAGCALAFSCEKPDRLVEDGDRVAVSFVSNINAAQKAIPLKTASIGRGGDISAAVNNNTWESNDAIGVFMVANGGTTIVEGAANKRYVTGGNGSFAAASGSEVYYPANGQVDFISYYPHDASIAGLGSYAVDVADQSDLAAIDLLYATADNSGQGYGQSASGPINLAFTHQLTRLLINTSAGAGVTGTDLQGMAITISGMNTRASFNLSNGIMDATGTPGTITPATVTNGQAYEAIVLPAEIAANTVSVTFELRPGTPDAEVFVWNLEATSFASGYEYAYNISFGRSGAANDVTVSATINEWLQGPVRSVNLIQEQFQTWTVSNSAALLNAMTNSAGGDLILCQPGVYDALEVNNVHKSEMVVVRAADRNNPPVFASHNGLLLRRVTNFTFDGFLFDGSSLTDAFGYPSSRAIRYGFLTDVVFRNCTFDFWHIGIETLNEPNNRNVDIVIEYNRFTRRGMDAIRIFRPHDGLTIRNNVVENDYIDETRSPESARHPDAIQFANADPGNHASVNVLIESNRFDLSDTYTHCMFIVPNSMTGGNYVEPGDDYYFDYFTIRNNDIIAPHVNAIGIGGTRNLLIAGNRFRKTPGTYQLGDPRGMPRINSYGFTFGTVSNNTGPHAPQAQRTGALANLTMVDNNWTDGALPVGWVDPTNLVGPYAYENN